MKSRFVYPIVLTAIIALLFTGCSGGGNPSPSQNVQPPPQTSADPATVPPAALSQQSRIVVAEMFTGDW